MYIYMYIHVYTVHVHVYTVHVYIHYPYSQCLSTLNQVESTQQKM